MGGLRVVVVAALLARSVGIKRPRGRPQRAKRRPPAPKSVDAPRRPLNCTFAAPTPAAGAARTATNARRSGLERADVAFDPLRTVQCGLERCAARWFDKVGTRATKKHLPLPAPPDAAELEFRLGGGIAYVFMPKVGSRRRRRSFGEDVRPRRRRSKTIVATIARSAVAAPPAQFGTFHAAATSPAPPFVFTFVRSPGAHLASGLGQAALHFYGPLPCYAYGHKCMEGTARMKIARAGRKASEEVRRPESPWGGGPAPARVSSWLAAATFEPGQPERKASAYRGKPMPFRNRQSRRVL
jgi:hypothetical protein